MKARFARFAPLAGAAMVCVSLTHVSPRAIGAQAEEAKPAAPQVVLSETYNAVTGIYFTNIAAHKGSHKPGLVERRFRADVKYWLMDTKYYERGELSIGNPLSSSWSASWAAKTGRKIPRRPSPQWRTRWRWGSSSSIPLSTRSRFI
jgi:hypothetical protein